jgi:uncharacterized damage-inducible protein DinB
MTSPLQAAFDHHVWATLRILEVCGELTDDQLATTVPGTYGSILDTLRHTVGADAGYLWFLSGGDRPAIDEEAMSLPALRREMEVDATAWAALIARAFDPDEVLVRRRDDGSETHAPRGIRLAQAVHHGTDHRSQICTALTTLGIEPPEIDVWDFGVVTGSVLEVEPTV